jgi:hypothetical protein
MCSVSHFILTVLLFIALTPGVLVRFPRRGSLINAAVVHGILFAILSYLLYFGIQRMSEGFSEGVGMGNAAAKPGTSPPVAVKFTTPLGQQTQGFVVSTKEGITPSYCTTDVNIANTVQTNFDNAMKNGGAKGNQKDGTLTANDFPFANPTTPGQNQIALCAYMDNFLQIYNDIITGGFVSGYTQVGGGISQLVNQINDPKTVLFMTDNNGTKIGWNVANLIKPFTQNQTALYKFMYDPSNGEDKNNQNSAAFIIKNKVKACK